MADNTQVKHESDLQDSDRLSNDQDNGRAVDGQNVSSAADTRVIEIGWQVVILPVALALVVWIGWQAGRMIAVARLPEAPIAASAPATNNVAQDGSVILSPDGQGGPVTIDLGGGAQQIAPQQRMDPNAIYPIAERFHPLKDQPAPDFTMRLLGTDEEVSLSDFQGQPVLINFWATWCPPCRAEMPWIESIYQKYKDAGLVVLAVDAGEKVPPSMVEETVQRYVTGSQLTFPVLLGDNTYDVQREYSVYGLPGTVLVTPEGTIAEYHSGMYPNEATLEDRIKGIMPGMEPQGPGSGPGAGTDGP